MGPAVSGQFWKETAPGGNRGHAAYSIFGLLQTGRVRAIRKEQASAQTGAKEKDCVNANDSKSPTRA